MRGAETQLANSIKEEIGSEREADEKIGSSVQALEQYVGKLDETVQGLSTTESIDRVMSQAVVPYVQYLAQLCSYIASVKLKEKKKRLDFIRTIAIDVSAVKSVLRHITKLDAGARELSRKLKGSIGKDSIKRVQTKLAKTKASLAKARKLSTGEYTAKSVNVLNKSVTDLESQITNLKKQRGVMQAKIKDIQDRVRDIRKITSVSHRSLKKAIHHENALIKTAGEFEKTIDDIRGAAAGFASAAAELSKGDVVAEKVPVDVTRSVGKLFNALLKVYDLQITFHGKGSVPFTDEMLEVLTETQALENHVKSLEKSATQLLRFWGEMQKALADLELEPLVSNDFIASVRAIRQTIVQAENARKREAWQTREFLQKSQTDLKGLTTSLTQSRAQFARAKDQVVQQLQKALLAIVEAKRQKGKRFERKATRATTRLARAQRQVGRRAA